MTDPVNKPHTVVTPEHPKTISEVIAAHQDDPANPHGGGILATCTCGEVYDFMPNHQQEMILRDCFPHLSAVHEDLIRKEPSIFLTKRYYINRHKDAETLLEALWEFIDAHTQKPNKTTRLLKGDLWCKGARDTAKKLKKLVIEHTV